MSAAAMRPLTERQQAVMERIDRRVPIKVIAQELGVSETRINQHIRALKNIYEAESLNELVEIYRLGAQTAQYGEEPFSETIYTKNQVPAGQALGDNSGRVDPGEIVFGDVLPLGNLAPWERVDEPRVVPGVLDGDHAVLLRFAAIAGIFLGILMAVVLAITATMAIGEALEGKAYVPVDETTSAS